MTLGDNDPKTDALMNGKPRRYTMPSGRPIDVPDGDPRRPLVEGMWDVMGTFSALIVPMIKDAERIGVLEVAVAGERRFSERDIKLLQTFADQAVIAIENARLIRELEESNRETTEALEQQTAMSEVLEIISRSTKDEQPVLEEIARQAAKLLNGKVANFVRLEGRELVYAAHYRDPEPGLARLDALLAAVRRDIDSEDSETAVAFRELQPLLRAMGRDTEGTVYTVSGQGSIAGRAGPRGATD